MKTSIAVPKQKENMYLSEQKQHSFSFHIFPEYKIFSYVIESRKGNVIVS